MVAGGAGYRIFKSVEEVGAFEIGYPGGGGRGRISGSECSGLVCRDALAEYFERCSSREEIDAS